MRERFDVRLADLTTLRVGGSAPRLLQVETADELTEVVMDFGRDRCFILGSGSNVLVSDDGIEVPVVRVATSGVDVARDGSDVELTVAAGESWDDLVARATDEGWSGIEALSGIPGSVGATPIQNVGAYGQEVADTVVRVNVLDSLAGGRVAMAPGECGFGYRTSIFKREQARFVVLSVTLRLRDETSSRPVTYAELATSLGLDVGGTASLSEVRDAVLHLRRGKAMVLDDTDHDTWSAGSFFTNPILDPESALPEEAPRWTQADGRVKTSAAWLIEQAGFSKGFGAGLGRGAATLSSKHTLAITNRGDATTSELLTLARTIRDGVRSRFAIELQPEPTLVGCRL